jgi:hypothetical protein
VIGVNGASICIVYRAAVTEVKEFYNRLIGVVKADHKDVLVGITASNLVNSDIALAVEQTGEVGFESLHGVLPLGGDGNPALAGGHWKVKRNLRLVVP